MVKLCKMKVPLSIFGYLAAVSSIFNQFLWNFHQKSEIIRSFEWCVQIWANTTASGGRNG